MEARAPEGERLDRQGIRLVFLLTELNDSARHSREPYSSLEESCAVFDLDSVQLIKIASG